MNIWSFNIGTWTLNIIDIAIIVICISRAIVGAVRGFFSDFSHTAGLIGGSLLGMLFTSMLLEKFSQSFPTFPKFLLSYLIFISLVLVGYIFFRIMGNTMEKVIDVINIDGLSIVMGFFWGLLVGIITVSIIIYVLSLQHIVDLSKFFDSSLFVSKVIEPMLPSSITYIKDLLNV